MMLSYGSSIYIVTDFCPTIYLLDSRSKNYNVKYPNIMYHSWCEETFGTLVALWEISMSLPEKGDTWICLPKSGDTYPCLAPNRPLYSYQIVNGKTVHVRALYCTVFIHIKVYSWPEMNTVAFWVWEFDMSRPCSSETYPWLALFCKRHGNLS